MAFNPNNQNANQYQCANRESLGIRLNRMEGSTNRITGLFYELKQQFEDFKIEANADRTSLRAQNVNLRDRVLHIVKTLSLADTRTNLFYTEHLRRSLLA